MKVYVILKGEYSDRHIVGVAIDKEHRDAIMEACAARDKYDDEPYVEEYDTEYWSPLLKGGRAYHVLFDEEGTAFAVIKHSEDDELDDDIDLYFEHKGVDKFEEETIQETCGICNGIYMIANVIALDERHAKKIAIDKRAEYLAKEAGIE